MHEPTSIANQQQSSPAAAANEAVHSSVEQLEPETELNERLPIQLKLSVGAANDPLEHEADAMADKVMRMPETSFIQRKCACADRDDEHVRLKPLASQITPFIQAKGDGAGTVSDAVSGKIKSSMGGGSPMAGTTKSFMESRFGTDFSDVKIHNGEESIQLSRELNAKAFTVGNNIYFNGGQYQPETDGGKHLLAHELTHVVQQGSSNTIRRFPGCSTAQNDIITNALIQARRASTQAIQAVAGLQSGTNRGAAALLERNFGTLTPAQITIVHDRMVAVDARLNSASAWRCDTESSYTYCAPPHSWWAGTNCPTTTDPTHLCPPVFRADADTTGVEPSRAIMLVHEALRAAGACGGFYPPGEITPPGSLINVYAYTHFIHSIASGSGATAPGVSPGPTVTGSTGTGQTGTSAGGTTPGNQFSGQLGLGAVGHSYLTTPSATDPAGEAVIQLGAALTHQFASRYSHHFELQGLAQLQISLSTGTVSIAGGGQLSYVVPFASDHLQWSAFVQALIGTPFNPAASFQFQPSIGTQLVVTPSLANRWFQFGAQASSGFTVQTGGPQSFDYGGGLFIQFVH